jgi:biopolymer transport protein ExbD
MDVHEHPPGRALFAHQVRQTFILTLAFLSTTILVIHVIITPIFSRGVWPLIDLVESGGGRKAPEQEGDVFVTITRTGDLFLNEQRATRADLQAAFQGAIRVRHDWRGDPYTHAIFIRVDRAAPFAAVRAVVRTAQDARVPRVTLLVRPKRDRAG